MNDATTIREDYSVQQFRIFGGRTMTRVDEAYRRVLETRSDAETANGSGPEKLVALEAALREFRAMPAGVQTMMAPHLVEHLQYLAARTGKPNSRH